MMIDENIRNLKSLNPTNESAEEKVDSFDDEPADEIVAEEECIDDDLMDEDDDDFDGWNVELKSEDNGSGLIARPNDVPITQPRQTLMEMLKSATADGNLNPALQVTLSIAPIFQIDRPYKLTYNNISDEEFREMFWSSNEHEVTAICVDYGTGCLSFITGYQSFLDGIKSKTFNLTTADIDKYDIRFTPYCTYAEAVDEYKSTLPKEEKEK